MTSQDVMRDYSKYDFKDPVDMYVYISRKGLSRETIEEISRIKNEPEWMLKFRLDAYEMFLKMPMPRWGGDLSKVDFDNIYYYAKPTDRKGRSWDDVPENIRKTFERLGIPEAERKFLAGVGAQYESETVYHKLREDLEKKGVIFCDTDTALKEHEDIFRKHFAKVVPPNDNKFAALNSAVWSGGSFVYIPEGVEVDMPLNAYFRINAQNMGQFERTLIIAEPYSKVHYIEGCTAPIYSTESLHCAVVEVIAKKGATVRYTTLQNWSNDVYNLVTKRAYAYEDAVVEWVDANIGSKLTMKYPSVYLLGKNARADLLSVAFAGKDQHQDTGAKAVHLAPNTTSKIISKSVSKDGGRTSYRGLLHVAKGATNVKSTVRCDALLIDEISRTDTYPYIEVNEDDATITHEASVGKIGEDQIFYIMSRGYTEQEALSLIVSGFLEVFTKELPMEYAVEFNRLIKMEMEGAVG
ncbi:FeS cluster assembly protein SufB [archaeon HR04]|nr:FeS cluster assembly protein SufB [archaeon HR04]